ncbi:MAG TPA: UDP-N-acetylglucosamine 1-carboxyvinyltransferase [Firmicutes bacterium]|nr:UDP-N-acetylglucosamine 1-carboxyvinyltransferase [Bacillota bacterium]
MESFVINGGNKLQGSLYIKGAKNSMLPIMAASVLSSSDKTIDLHNIPDIHDMHVMKKILQSLGAEVQFQNNTLRINVKNLKSYTISDELMREMRSSIFLMGPLLSKLGKVRVTYPGGCSIGPRPIDLHFKGLEAMGAVIREENGSITASAPRLTGTEIHLDYPSVGATENLMMTAVLARGKTVIYNAAKEPEIVDLQNFLNAMGARVRGAGTETLRITGVKELGHCSYRIIPDRIVAGTYLIAAAITGSNMQVKGIIPAHLDAVVAKMREAGVTIKVADDSLEVVESDLHAVETLRTLPYPGFPTDLQPQMMALLALAKGNSNIIESVFEARFKHVDEFNRLRANIVVDGRTAIIRGVDKLYGAEVHTTDLRAGAALILAGLAAEGTTVIRNIQHIDRGYERIEDDLKKVGAKIERKRH